MTTWVLVADNSRARFFAAERPASPLEEVHDLVDPRARMHEGDLITDKGGRGGGNGAGSHSIPVPSAKTESAERFAQMVCEKLEASRTAGDFARLYVVAAPGFLGHLRKLQSAPLKQLVVSEVDKNLTGQDGESIRKHLPQFL